MIQEGSEMKKAIIGTVTALIVMLLSACAVYGQNPAFVPGSFLWQEEGYLMGMPGETARSVLDQNFKTAAEVQSNTGEPLSDSDYVGTGATVKAEEQLEAVILGDVTGDGRVTSTDYLRIKRVFSGDMTFEGAYGVAADVDADGKINSTDYLKIKKCFEGSVDLYTGLKIDPYVSGFEHKDYDRSGYRMDRSKFNIGIFEYGTALNNDADMKKFKEEFGGDFIVLGSNRTAFYNLCEKYQVGFFAKGKNLPRYTYGTASERLQDPTDFTEFETKLADYKDNYTYLWGDDVFDEPNAEYFDWMKGVTERYQTRFDDRMIYFNLHPFAPGGPGNGHGAANYRDYIAQYIEKVNTDYISFDIYPFDNQFSGMHPFYLENLDVVASACRESGRDFWIITQTGSTDAAKQMNKEQVSWQMYTALAYGAKTLVHACYTPCWWVDGTSLVNKDGTYTALWSSVRDLNTEVKAISDVYMQYDSLGVFGMGTPQNSFVATQIRTQNRRNEANGYSGARGFSDITASRGLLVGSFEEKAGNGYAMMLVDSSDPYKGDNGSNAVTFRTAVSENVKVTAYIGGTSTVLTPTDGVYTVEIANGQGCFVTVE